MNAKVLDAAIELTKAAIEASPDGSGLAHPDYATKFLEEIADKLEELANRKTTKE